MRSLWHRPRFTPSTALRVLEEVRDHCPVIMPGRARDKKPCLSRAQDHARLVTLPLVRDRLRLLSQGSPGDGCSLCSWAARDLPSQIRRARSGALRLRPPHMVCTVTVDSCSKVSKISKP